MLSMPPQRRGILFALLLTAAASPTSEVQHVPPDQALAILGHMVADPEGKDIGRLVDVLVGDQGQPQAAVIDFGGFLGVGNRKIAVEWSVLHFAPTDPKHPITLDLTQDQIKAAPEYKDVDQAGAGRGGTRSAAMSHATRRQHLRRAVLGRSIWLNFFIADVQTGFGPFVAVYLTMHKWTQVQIGFALTLGTIVALISQLPAGALVDAVHNKRVAASGALIGVIIAALLLAIQPTELPVTGRADAARILKLRAHARDRRDQPASGRPRRARRTAGT